MKSFTDILNEQFEEDKNQTKQTNQKTGNIFSIAILQCSSVHFTQMCYSSVYREMTSICLVLKILVKH